MVFFDRSNNPMFQLIKKEGKIYRRTFKVIKEAKGSWGRIWFYLRWDKDRYELRNVDGPHVHYEVFRGKWNRVIILLSGVGRIHNQIICKDQMIFIPAFIQLFKNNFLFIKNVISIISWQKKVNYKTCFIIFRMSS